MMVWHHMTITANSKGPRISIPSLCSKWFFGGIRIYNAEITPHLRYEI